MDNDVQKVAVSIAHPFFFEICLEDSPNHLFVMAVQVQSSTALSCLLFISFGRCDAHTDSLTDPLHPFLASLLCCSEYERNSGPSLRLCLKPYPLVVDIGGLF